MIEVDIKDDRLKAYVEKAYKKLGIIFKKELVDTAINISDKWELINREEFLSFFGAKPYIEVYKNKEKSEFLAVFFQSTGDGWIYTVWKTKICLSVKQVRTTLLSLQKLEQKFWLKDPYFICWECGHRSHILDIQGDLDTKLNKYEDECCCE